MRGVFEVTMKCTFLSKFTHEIHIFNLREPVCICVCLCVPRPTIHIHVVPSNLIPCANIPKHMCFYLRIYVWMVEEADAGRQILSFWNEQLWWQFVYNFKGSYENHVDEDACVHVAVLRFVYSHKTSKRKTAEPCNKVRAELPCSL